jgi:hypothetical protein
MNNLLEKELKRTTEISEYIYRYPQLFLYTHKNKWFFSNNDITTKNYKDNINSHVYIQAQNLKDSLNKFLNSVITGMIYIDKKPENNNDVQFITISFNPVTDPINYIQIGNTMWKFLANNTKYIGMYDSQTLHILTNPISISNYDIAQDFNEIVIELDYSDLPFNNYPKVLINYIDHRIKLYGEITPFSLKNGTKIEE